MRHTKIVATIGPATDSLASLRLLAKNGMNVARLNFSHGSRESHAKTLGFIHTLNKEGKEKVGILLDTKGPEIRTRDVAAPLVVRKGDTVIFTPRRTGKEQYPVVEIAHDAFAKDARGSTQLLVDNGTIEFRILSVKKNAVIAKALDSGSIGSRRHVNLPGADISVPTFTENDWKDIGFGIKQGIDFVAPSFIRTGKDIRQLRAFLDGKKANVQIVAKIETKQAIDHLDDILKETDAVMVARGDLGSEIAFELVPGLQDEIVLRCRRLGKPVIVATHMLESMIVNPMPTRAELTDIAHAALTQADAVMLSGETASGKYPFKSVDAMRRVLTETEERYATTLDGFLTTSTTNDVATPRSEQARAACLLAKNIGATAIIVITRQGRTARAVSSFRPYVPILAFSDTETVVRQMALVWGVFSSLLTLAKDPEKTVNDAMADALRRKHVRAGDAVVVVSDILSKTGNPKRNHVMSVQIRQAR